MHSARKACSTQQYGDSNTICSRSLSNVCVLCCCIEGVSESPSFHINVMWANAGALGLASGWKATATAEPPTPSAHRYSPPDSSLPVLLHFIPHLLICPFNHVPLCSFRHLQPRAASWTKIVLSCSSDSQIIFALVSELLLLFMLCLKPSPNKVQGHTFLWLLSSPNLCCFFCICSFLCFMQSGTCW